MFYWRTDQTFWKAALLLLLLAIPLVSCESEKSPAAFYPIDSLVSAQAGHLSNIKAGLFKEALLSGETDTLTYTPHDSVAWINELDIFRKLDIINKPVNTGSYLVDDGLLDRESNLTVKAFTSIKKLPVVYLKIYYQGTMARPRKIEALYDEGSPLHQSARLLSMYFQQIENKTVLTSYAIRGGQKMMFGDSVAFFINGKILVD
ncbi:MAG: hypothetical protein WEB30_10545 [Cyclobacteriaceae bacterium]